MKLPNLLIALSSVVLLSSLRLAHADCSRPIIVPVATIGFSVILGNSANPSSEQISGVYPDLLRSLPSRCQFVFSAVPRARLEAMFEAGKADLLMPASKTPKRDEFGIFVSLVASRPMLISTDPIKVKVSSLADLIEQKQLRIALVRGFDYGSAYQDLIKALEKQGRLSYETDALAVGRLMQAGLIDLTIMAPSIFVAGIDGDPRALGLQEKLRFDALPEFPWGESGIYISRSAVAKQDRQTLQGMLQTALHSGQVWKAFQKYYRPEVLAGSIRPKEAKASNQP